MTPPGTHHDDRSTHVFDIQDQKNQRPSLPKDDADAVIDAGQRTAAGRLLSILDTFDQDHLELSLSEISRRAELTLSTTHRLVGELVEWGALERTPSGHYTIGMRVLELGSLEPQILHLQAVAGPYLSDLQAAINANVHLSIRDQLDVVYIDDLQQQQGAHVLSRLGGRWPLHTTATGMVLLAFAPPQVRDEALSGRLKRYTEHTITDVEVLRKMLSEVRRTGFAVLNDSITVGACAVGLPVRGPRNREIAAVSVTLNRNGIHTPMNVLPTVAATARALSRALGAPSPRGAADERPYRPYAT